ncbi:MAG: glycosyltransferase family 9 protein [Chloroflexi bacterium]|nr:glycosyltransferase family 9 protein [Chloroflexota bacterium]
MTVRRILVVKLADIGDVLTATPALRALRRAHPAAHITALVTPLGAAVLDGSPLVDGLMIFPKARFDRVAEAVTPRALALGLGLARRLRAGRFDAVAVLHHLTTRWGALKYAALALATGAPVRAGLDNGLGRAGFLTHRAGDLGFGAHHEVEYWEEVVRLLGAEPDGGPLEFPLRPADRAFAAALLPPGGPRVAIHPGSGAFSPARRWPVERFNTVAHTLARQDGVRVVLVGGPGEAALAAQAAAGVEPPPLDLAGRTTLGQLAAMLERCDVFLGSDSGVMHLAAAVGTPVVAVFGPSNHRAWGPWTGRGRESRATVLRVDLPCSPCVYIGVGLGTPQGCPERTCLVTLSPEHVTEAVRRMLGVALGAEG